MIVNIDNGITIKLLLCADDVDQKMTWPTTLESRMCDADFYMRVRVLCISFQSKNTECSVKTCPSD